MRIILTGLLLMLTHLALAQSSVIGQLQKNDSTGVEFAYVALYRASDSIMVKVETADENGKFELKPIAAGNYFLRATFLGLPDFERQEIIVDGSSVVDLGLLTFNAQEIALDAFEITAERAMVEVQPDKTVFNVQGTVNSTGSDAISLLRKAPAVTVDNNDNINVLGRSGVRLYVDGKQLPLEGEDLANYLKNLPADQIDRIEIITNPGSKYDAEGNAGIIDIRLKKDDSIGANGSISGTYTQGQLTRYNVNANGNYRNKRMNVFATVGVNQNDNFHNIRFKSYQNGFYMNEINDTENLRDIYNYRTGADFYLNKNNIIGFLVTGQEVEGERIGYNRIAISDADNISEVDSILLAEGNGQYHRSQNTFNLNYRFNNDKKHSLNIDLDYGMYGKTEKRFQPNLYYNAAEDVVLTEINQSFDTPTDINIATAKADYELPMLKGTVGIGTKYSRVETYNTFKVFDVVDEEEQLNTTQSNQFDYTENVYAGYLNYARSFGSKWKLSAGLRAEKTYATGELTAFDTALTEPPVVLDYMSWFPSIGITHQLSQTNSISFNYGRRINRPDYNVLNPFRNQLSQLSIEKGNPFLNPEIVNNVELGYTLFYMYNFKVGYSRTNNKITRLIGPDESNPKAGFISWDNLATQTVISANASLPVQFTKWWDGYFNLSGSRIDNQADYGDGAVVDVQAWSYTIFSQQSFKLPKSFKAQVSGYYSGPGVWGGVFIYDANWSIDAGIQRNFLKDKLLVRTSVNNIFNRFGWRGESSFNGLVSTGTGSWDARFVSLNIKYSFGNQKLKFKQRKTGIESEEKRTGE